MKISSTTQFSRHAPLPCKPDSATTANPASSLHRRRILQGVNQSLITFLSTAFNHSPAIVIVDESNGGVVLGVLCVESCTHVIHRSPSPLKINISQAPIFMNSGHRQQFPLGYRHTD